MFRPTSTADLNEFPALGTPPPMNRPSALPNSTTPSMANRLASYASTASNFAQHHDFDSIDFTSKNHLGMNAFNGELPPSSNNRNIPPRSFSMDDFPALGRSNVSFENSFNRESSGKPEQWLDYTNLRDNQQPGGSLFVSLL
jgi:hypothetical protein